MTTRPPTRAMRACLELMALFLSSTFYMYSEHVLGYRLVPILVLLFSWGIYLFDRIRHQPDFLKDCGVRTDNIMTSLKLNAGVLLIGLLFLICMRYAFGWEPLPANSVIIFVLYPFWAFVQQFALEGLVVRNLRTIGLPVLLTVITGATAYGLAHLPDVPLSIITSIVGVIWVSVFLRCRNIIPLSITHAILGTCTYYWLLERDPVQELFQTTIF